MCVLIAFTRVAAVPKKLVLVLKDKGINSVVGEIARGHHFIQEKKCVQELDVSRL